MNCLHSILPGEEWVNYFRKKVPWSMFDCVLNTLLPLIMEMKPKYQESASPRKHSQLSQNIDSMEKS